MEAGISHDGDMDDLGAILNPDIGLVLNAGAGHLEGLAKKRRGLAQGKAVQLSCSRRESCNLRGLSRTCARNKKYGVEFCDVHNKTPGS